MKTLLILLLIGAMGFLIYKNYQKAGRIRDLTAQVEECERKIGQLESELSRLKVSPLPHATGLDGSAASLTPAPSAPAPSPSGNWMWDKNRKGAPLETPTRR